YKKYSRALYNFLTHIRRILYKLIYKRYRRKMKKPTTQSMEKTTEMRIQNWLSGAYDPKTKAEIRRLQHEDPQELIDAFYTDLVFGTGGLRGIMGVGPNRMNLYTVRGASQGLANYLKRQPLAKGSRHHSVLIGYDNRANSRLF